MAMALAPKKAVYFAAHPDDEAARAGTLFRLKRELGENLSLTVVACTLGSSIRGMAMRGAELTASCARLGAKLAYLHDLPRVEVSCRINGEEAPKWRIDSGEVHTGRVALLRVFQVFQDEAPDIVFAPFLQDSHPEHKAVARLVHEAALKYSLVENTRLICLNYGVWSDPVHSYYHNTMTLPANLFVYIDGAPHDAKYGLLRLHASELARFDLDALMECQDRANGIKAPEFVNGSGSSRAEARFAESFLAYDYFVKSGKAEREFRAPPKLVLPGEPLAEAIFGKNES